MLTKLGESRFMPKPIPIADAGFPAPFRSTLEFGAPARGAWNIVHTGMLLPEGHQIFVCAQGCLRGVVLTAAEMGASGRFSTVTIEEHNGLDGDMEELIIEGVTDILQRLPKLPRAVLVYTSCVHHFMGSDLALCYDELRRRFPDVAFTDCYMNPIMRKSGITPDALMRRQLYSLLETREKAEKTLCILGNNIRMDDSADLKYYAGKAGRTLREIHDCGNYEEYLALAESEFAVTTQIPAKAAGADFEKRHGRKSLHLPLCYGAEEIRRCMRAFCEELGMAYDGDWDGELTAEAALSEARFVIGDAPVTVDYTATPRPLSLARLLLEHGFRVTRIYADSFTAEEKDDYLWLREKHPGLEIWPTVAPEMRVAERTYPEKTLAIGQKAAYFTGTPYFVNMVEGGGHYGFDGIAKLATEMREAFLNEKDAPRLIGQKGLGCSCCL
ncbi:MAG: nitrogenase [Oscillospiraceae bacterium]|nr:nitrogenase [Oscillospiraceae bacterium]